MHKVHVETGKPYDVMIGSGLMEKAGEMIARGINEAFGIVI